MPLLGIVARWLPVARGCGVRLLVLSLFSQRYPDPERFREEAGARFAGEIVLAADLDRVAVPPRV